MISRSLSAHPVGGHVAKRGSGAKILIVGNGTGVIPRLEAALNQEGFDVAVASDGVKALRVAQAQQPDLVVLAPTFAWLGGEQLRRQPRPDSLSNEDPLIVLSPRTEETVRIMPRLISSDGRSGASFNMAELLTRLKRLQQRTQVSHQHGSLRIGIVEMDLEAWMVSVSGKAVALSAKEFGLLRMLLNSKGRVLTRDALRSVVWEHEEGHQFDSRTIDVHVGRLRRKLGAAGSYIITVRGTGYRFSPIPEES